MIQRSLFHSRFKYLGKFNLLTSMRKIQQFYGFKIEKQEKCNSTYVVLLKKCV